MQTDRASAGPGRLVQIRFTLTAETLGALNDYQRRGAMGGAHGQGRGRDETV